MSPTALAGLPEPGTTASYTGPCFIEGRPQRSEHRGPIEIIGTLENRSGGLDLEVLLLPRRVYAHVPVVAWTEWRRKVAETARPARRKKTVAARRSAVTIKRSIEHSENTNLVLGAPAVRGRLAEARAKRARLEAEFDLRPTVANMALAMAAAQEVTNLMMEAATSGNYGGAA